MILRRFMKHVSDQNWFAVGLDALVVIVGIFLGMQATEWNETRKDRIEEEQYLQRLRDDLDLQFDHMKLRVDYLTVAQKDNELITSFLRAPEKNTLPLGRVLAAFYNSTVIYPFRPISMTYDELISTGKIHLIHDINIRSHIAQYYYESAPLEGAWDVGDDNPYRLYVRSVMPLTLQNRTVTTCEISKGNSLYLRENCVIIVETAEAKEVLQKLIDSAAIKALATGNLSKLTIALRLYKSNEQTARLLRANLEGSQ